MKILSIPHSKLSFRSTLLPPTFLSTFIKRKRKCNGQFEHNLKYDNISKGEEFVSAFAVCFKG